MLGKVGSGGQGRLICADCGLPQVREQQPRRSATITTALLIAGSAATAALLMALQDQRPPSLLDAQELRLKGRDAQSMPLRRLARLRRDANEGRD